MIVVLSIVSKAVWLLRRGILISVVDISLLMALATYFDFSLIASVAQ